jgi:hypothetical protein
VLHKIPIMQIKSPNLPRKIVMMHSLTLHGSVSFKFWGAIAFNSKWKLGPKQKHNISIIIVKWYPRNPRNKNPAGSLMSMQDLVGRTPFVFFGVKFLSYMMSCAQVTNPIDFANLEIRFFPANSSMT